MKSNLSHTEGDEVGDKEKKKIHTDRHAKQYYNLHPWTLAHLLDSVKC